jgi:hypothetical protein
MTDRTVSVGYDSKYDGFSLNFTGLPAGESYRLSYSYSGTSLIGFTPKGSITVNKYSNTNMTNSNWIEFTTLQQNNLTPKSCNRLSTETVKTGTEARRQAIFSAGVDVLR